MVNTTGIFSLTLLSALTCASTPVSVLTFRAFSCVSLSSDQSVVVSFFSIFENSTSRNFDPILGSTSKILFHVVWTFCDVLSTILRGRFPVTIPSCVEVLDVIIHKQKRNKSDRS